MRREIRWYAAGGAVLLLLLATGIWLKFGRETAPAGDAALAPSHAPVSSRDKPACGSVATTDVAGNAVNDALLTPVRSVHDAACRRDYSGVSRLMDRPFGSRTPEAAVAELQADNGASLTILTQTLEVAAIADQGGLIYCHPHGAIAIFARETSEHQSKLTDFAITGDSPAEAACFEHGSR
ncbi:hypothetical protein Q5425_27900 [Amycolatopsis sp. A133]|uniref:hypothetical protein n=1 Tax=Amycolatopsis sp. A133 TaxID=3064472 RepID=UPI0027FA84C1|nr:hypothetical protein [Amycolatopsis sp. A133]MDQ7807577.1 hypothetical protein [Amycolatopsis sp. A133]